MGRHGRERRPATEAPSRSWPTTEPDDALTAPQAPVTDQNPPASQNPPTDPPSAADRSPTAGHDHGHGHGHGHGPAAPASRRVRILLAVFLVPCAIASVVGVLLLYPFSGVPPVPGARQQIVDADVAAVTPADCSQAAPGQKQGPQDCVALSLMMTDGAAAGHGIVSVFPVEPTSPKYRVGDKVVLQYGGGDPNDTGSYQVADFQRSTSLWVLGLLFAAAVILLGRWRGVAALVALGVSFVVLIMFMLPAILDGRGPLAVALVGACLIMFAVLYLS
ncbi:MAG: hypothetical protein QOH45_674, partial [Pseudonocardiales bacterium]|nr:hypothetical protein [Pseudonocardiales bacterium]